MAVGVNELDAQELARRVDQAVMLTGKGQSAIQTV